jgi:hypothetical protein
MGTTPLEALGEILDAWISTTFQAEIEDHYLQYTFPYLDWKSHLELRYDETIFAEPLNTSKGWKRVHSGSKVSKAHRPKIVDERKSQDDEREEFSPDDVADIELRDSSIGLRSPSPRYGSVSVRIPVWEVMQTLRDIVIKSLPPLRNIMDAYDPPFDLDAAMNLARAGPQEDQHNLRSPTWHAGLRFDGKATRVRIL